MSVESATKTSLITDRINALDGRSLSEFERRALKREIESLKSTHLYEYHMLMGIFSALTDDLDKAIEHHEKSLPGGDGVFYRNFAYTLREFCEYPLSLKYMIEAHVRDLGSFILFDEVCLCMIHAADFSKLESVVDRFTRANPHFDLTESIHFMNSISMQEALKHAEVPVSDFSKAKEIVDKILSKHGVIYKVLVHNLRFSGGSSHVSLQMMANDLEPERIADVNAYIAEAMVESGLSSWNKLVFMLAAGSAEPQENENVALVVAH